MLVLLFLGGGESINSSTVASIIKSNVFSGIPISVLKLKGKNGDLRAFHKIDINDFNILTTNGIFKLLQIIFYPKKLKLLGLHIKPNIIALIIFLLRLGQDCFLVNVRCSYTNLKTIDKRLFYFISFFCHKIIYPSQIAFETYPKRYLYKSKVVPNGIMMRSERRVLNRKTNKLKIVFIGRLDPVKNFKLLFQIVDSVEKIKNVEFHVFGRGSLVNEIKDFSKNRKAFHYHGYSKQIYSILPDFDVLISTSLNEGFSKVLIEAADAGLFILSTPVGGTSELIKDGINGKVVENITEFKDEIKSLSEKGFDRRKLIEYNNLILNKFSITNYASQVKRIFEENS